MRQFQVVKTKAGNAYLTIHDPAWATQQFWQTGVTPPWGLQRVLKEWKWS